MALGGTVRSVVAEESHEGQEGCGQESIDGISLHEQLVAYTDAVSRALLREQRTGVWGVWNEHSYARARSGAPSASVRVLLAPPASRAPSSPADFVDITGESREPLPLPRDRAADDEIDAVDRTESDDDWEERVVAHPPSKAHGRLARAALQALSDARLARLAGRGGRAARREEARAAAARFRAALAPLWARPGPPALRPPAWLHSQLSSHLPASYRTLYQDVLAELRRVVPRLAERLGAARLPHPSDDPLAPDKERTVRSAQATGPWLAWVRCGCGRGESRWERRLGAMLHMRVLTAAAGLAGAAAAPPDRWSAATLHAAKLALADVIEDARGHAVIVGGAGSGAAMAAALAAGASGEAPGVRGVLLVALAPLTTEGPRDLPDDVLHEISVPVLAVCGGRGAGALAGGARRVLAVAGADAALRLPLRARRRLRLPQHALDAALVEEMVRWCLQLADAQAPHDIDEYAHLPALAPLTPLTSLTPACAPCAPSASVHVPAPAPPAQVGGGSRAVEFVEGRVVARMSGSTPLLLTPRRAPPAPCAAPAASAPAPAAVPPVPGAPASLAAADIMQLPIVFADDEPPALPALAPLYSEPELGVAEKSVTVTSGGARGSGGIRYTRVIVAKRGSGGARGAARRARLPRP